jgi:hypothetical protein
MVQYHWFCIKHDSAFSQIKNDSITVGYNYPCYVLMNFLEYKENAVILPLCCFCYGDERDIAARCMISSSSCVEDEAGKINYKLTVPLLRAYELFGV